MTQQDQPSRYGAAFDAIADRWAAIEREHDQVHPDRGECGGVGRCAMMARAYDLGEAMREALERWRKPDGGPREIVVGTDEAATALWTLGGATARGHVAELLRGIITAGRSTRVVLEDPVRPVLRQFARLEDMEAAIAAGELPMPPAPPLEDDPVAKRLGIVRCCDLHGATCKPPSELCCPNCTERNHPDHPNVACVLQTAADQYAAMLEIIQAAGDNGIMPGGIMAEMIRRGRAWARRSEMFPALKAAMDKGLIEQPLPRGRYHWVPTPPSDGGDQ